MLTKDNFTLKHMMELKQDRTVDSFILERSIYAFGLLEALCRVEIPFIFKGVTSLSKCFGLIQRFSEDIDLILDWRVLGYGKDEPWERRSNTKQDTFNKEANARAEKFLSTLSSND